MAIDPRQLWGDDASADFILVLGEEGQETREMKVHKAVLEGASSYFKSAVNNFAEAREGKLRVDCDVSSGRAFVEALYKGPPEDPSQLAQLLSLGSDFFDYFDLSALFDHAFRSLGPALAGLPPTPLPRRAVCLALLLRHADHPLLAGHGGLVAAADQQLREAVQCMADALQAYAQLPLDPQRFRSVEHCQNAIFAKLHLAEIDTGIPCLHELLKQLPPAHMQCFVDTRQLCEDPQGLARRDTLGSWGMHQRTLGAGRRHLWNCVFRYVRWRYCTREEMESFLQRHPNLIPEDSVAKLQRLEYRGINSVCLDDCDFEMYQSEDNTTNIGAVVELDSPLGWSPSAWPPGKRHPEYQLQMFHTDKPQLMAGLALVPVSPSSGRFAFGVFVGEADRQLQYGEEVEALWAADSAFGGEVTLKIEVKLPMTNEIFEWDEEEHSSHTLTAYRSFAPGSNVHFLDLPFTAQEQSHEQAAREMPMLFAVRVAVEDVPAGWPHGVEGVAVREHGWWTQELADRAEMGSS